MNDRNLVSALAAVQGIASRFSRTRSVSSSQAVFFAQIPENRAEWVFVSERLLHNAHNCLVVFDLTRLDEDFPPAKRFVAALDGVQRDLPAPAEIGALLHTKAVAEAT